MSRAAAARRGRSVSRAADRGPSSVRELQEPLARYLLILVVLGSVLAVGTVHSATLAIFGSLACIAGALAIWRGELPGVVPPPAAIALGLAVFTAFQAVPLPISVATWLSPESADIWRAAFGAIGESPAFVSVSLDPGASWREAAKWLSYGALFFAAASVGARKGAAYGIAVVFVAATIVSVLGMAHDLLNVTRLYGFYQPEGVRTGGHVAPLLNPNNLGGYASVGAICGLGLILGRDFRWSRIIVATGAALCIGVVVIASSRGAVLTLTVGLLAVALFAVTRVRRSLGGRRLEPLSVVIVLGVVAVGVVLGGLALGGLTRRPFVDDGLAKLDLPLHALRMTSDFPFFGVGRGAFDGVFPAYGFSGASPAHVFTHPENLIVQWATEWGAPIAVAAIVCFAWALRPSRLGVRGPITVLAAYIAVLALAVQNLVDLSLEVPGVMYAVVCLLGCMWGAEYREREPVGSSRHSAVARWPVAAALGLSVAAAAAVVALLLWGMTTPGGDRRTVARAFATSDFEDSASVAAFRATLEAQIRRRPADPYYYRMAGHAAASAADQPVLPWLTLALQREPNHASTHLLAAWVFARQGARDRALKHLRRAAESNWAAVGTETSARAVAWAESGGFPELILAVPRGEQGVPMLAAMSKLVEDPALADRLVAEALVRTPESVAMNVARGERLLDALAGERPPCVGRRERCLGEAQRVADVALERGPSDVGALVLQARLLEIADGSRAADDYLAAKCLTLSDLERCLYARTRFAMRAGRDAAKKAGDVWLRTACSHGSERCARAAEQLSETAMHRGHRWLALDFAQRAAREFPNVARWRRVAERASALGAYSQALGALTRASRLAGADAQGLGPEIEAMRLRVLEEANSPR